MGSYIVFRLVPIVIWFVGRLKDVDEQDAPRHWSECFRNRRARLDEKCQEREDDGITLGFRKMVLYETPTLASGNDSTGGGSHDCCSAPCTCSRLTVKGLYAGMKDGELVFDHCYVTWCLLSSVLSPRSICGCKHFTELFRHPCITTRYSSNDPIHR